MRVIVELKRTMVENQLIDQIAESLRSAGFVTDIAYGIVGKRLTDAPLIICGDIEERNIDALRAHPFVAGVWPDSNIELLHIIDAVSYFFPNKEVKS